MVLSGGSGAAELPVAWSSAAGSGRPSVVYGEGLGGSLCRLAAHRSMDPVRQMHFVMFVLNGCVWKAAFGRLWKAARVDCMECECTANEHCHTVHHSGGGLSVRSAFPFYLGT